MYRMTVYLIQRGTLWVEGQMNIPQGARLRDALSLNQGHFMSLVREVTNLGAQRVALRDLPREQLELGARWELGLPLVTEAPLALLTPGTSTNMAQGQDPQGSTVQVEELDSQSTVDQGGLGVREF